VTSQLAPLPELQFETAEEHATKNVPIASPEDRAAAVRTSLVGKRFEAINEVVVRLSLLE
jgi:hypothetical protein